MQNTKLIPRKFYNSGKIRKCFLGASLMMPPRKNPGLMTYIAGGHVNPAMANTIDRMYKYLTNTKKLSPLAASAIMGNVFQESSFNSSAVSNKGATGYLQFLGNLQKDYTKWLRGKTRHEFSQLDYILESLLNNNDLYYNEYNRVKQSKQRATEAYNAATGANKVRRKQELDNITTYMDNIYGARERSNTLYPYSDLLKALYDKSYSIDSLSDLWHNTIERSNPKEANLDRRRKAANDIYNHYNY